MSKSGIYGADTETFGLRWFDRDDWFSAIIADETEEYYFNFLDAPDHTGFKPPENEILPDKQILLPVFSNPDSKWFFHNAKFDMGMLARDGLCPTGTIHCTEAIARLCDSNHFKYSLQLCMERMAQDLGIPVTLKSDAVYDYVIKHKLYENIKIPGKQKLFKNMHYDKVPLSELFPYGCIDARAARELGMYQVQKLRSHVDKSKNIGRVYYLERDVTKTVFKMETCGLPVDLQYTKEGFEKLQPVLRRCESEYKEITGNEFVDSGVAHEPYFKSQGIELALSEDGNPKVDKHVLGSLLPDPVASLILDHRHAAKLSGTYFSSYLYYAAHDGRIHPTYKQTGARTSRFSMLDPNLQNVPRPDEDEPEDNEESSTVRRCFKPPEGWCMFMPDFDQMEFRLMLDLAGENSVIDLILGGLDVHEATAKMMGVPRKQAKTINFMLLYGGGAAKLAGELGIDVEEAKRLKALYFDRLPMVSKWIRNTISKAKIRKYATSWYGRLYTIDPKFAYKAPNYEIQGGSSDIVKLAMVEIDKLLTKSKAETKMALQVHDELIFLMPPNELDLAPQITKIMETAYPPRRLPLTVGAAYSWTNWSEKTDGFPKII